MPNLIITMGFGEFNSLFDGDFDSTAKGANVKRSLDNYISNNMSGTSVQIEGLPFNDTETSTWIQPRILDIIPEFVRDASESGYGEQTNILYQVNIYVKKSGTTLSDKHYMIRDEVAQFFKIGEDIPLYDYVSGTTFVDNLRVRSIETDFTLPETDELLQYVIAWEMDYTKITSNP